MPIDPSLTTFPTARAAPGALTRGVLWIVTFGRSGRTRAVQEEITRAGLPARASGLVRDVCGRTSLWASERREVARELSTHLRDGLDAGVPEEELVRTFGDTGTAARLITRARKRQRPLAWRVYSGARVAMGWTLAGLAGLYGLLALRYWTAEPTLSRNFYQELVTRLEGAPEDQRGWPLYRKAVMEMPIYPNPGGEVGLGKHWPDVRPGDEEFAVVVEHVRAAAPQLAMVREAASRPTMGYAGIIVEDQEMTAALMRRAGRSWKPTGAETPPENPDLIGVLLPHLGQMRQLARYFTFDTRLAILDKDGARVEANIRAVLGMSRQLNQEPFLISQLVGYAVASLAMDRITEVLRDAPDLLSDQQLVAIAHDLAISPSRGRILPSIEGERMMMLDAAQRIYTDDGNGDGRITPAGARHLEQLLGMSHNDTELLPRLTLHAVGPIGSAAVATRSELLAEYERLIGMTERIGRLAPWERIDDAEQNQFGAEFERLSQSAWWRQRYIVLKILMPAFEKAYWSADQSTLNRDGTLCVIAMHLYRREHGRWPASLEELTPRFMPTVPLDMYTGKPLRYVPPSDASGQPLLYSIGSDLRDDGGVPAQQGWGMGGPPRRLAPNAPHADWVFWPAPIPSRPEPVVPVMPPPQESEGESVPVPQPTS